MMIEKNAVVNAFIDCAMEMADDLCISWDEVEVPIRKCIELIYKSCVSTPVGISALNDEATTITFKLDNEFAEDDVLHMAGVRVNDHND